MKTDNEIIMMVLELFIIKQRKTLSYFQLKGLTDSVANRELDIYQANLVLNKLKNEQGAIN